jgi:dTDP-4-amino-4,6-dideoxygalactose transaminase
MKIFSTIIDGNDSNKIRSVLEAGDLGFGPNVNLFENEFANFSKRDYNISTSSASASAFIIFSYMKELYGTCDVYTTSLGFTSPAWAAKHFGHNLIFVDVNDDLQFCSEHYKSIRKETNNKIVLMPVLYGGVSAIQDFNPVGDEIIVVDSAHCPTPTMHSDYVFFSFHPYKPICSSDGGMISTNDEQASEYFKKYRNFGRKNVGGSYTISSEGFKFYMNNLNATIALTQLQHYNKLLNQRIDNFNKLSDSFALLNHDDKSSYYFATCLTDEADAIISKYKLARHYPMLHLMEYYRNGQSLPKLENIHGKILNLPLYKKVEL